MTNLGVGVVVRRTLVVMTLAVSAVLAQEVGAAAPAEPQGPKIDWVLGPADGTLGKLAQVKVPEGFVFADGTGTRKFLEMTQNPTSGKELGMLMTSRDGEQAGPRFFVIFEFDEIGYIKDDEKDELDADAILKSLREGTAAGNEYRKEHGWETLEVVGWEKPPFYDPKTNNLTWATRVRSSSGGESVNWSTRLLGRKGVMNVDLVLAPEDLPAALPEFETTLGSFDYVAGNKYSEWKAGDKVAAIGLGALVVGGAGAVAAKLGLLGKFWKLILAGWKFIAVGVIAAAGVLRKFIGRVFRGNEDVITPPPPPSEPAV